MTSIGKQEYVITVGKSIKMAYNWIQQGLKGSGKTARGVYKAIKQNKKPILSNMKLIDIEYEYCSDHDLIIKMKEVMEAKTKEIQNYLYIKYFGGRFILIDECEFMFDAREGSSKITKIATGWYRFTDKKDADFFGVCHILESDTDKRIRKLAQYVGTSYMVDKEGKVIIDKDREKDYGTLYIVNEVWCRTPFGWRKVREVINPESIYKNYDTREILWFDRGKIK